MAQFITANKQKQRSSQHSGGLDHKAETSESRNSRKVLDKMKQVEEKPEQRQRV